MDNDESPGVRTETTKAVTVEYKDIEGKMCYVTVTEWGNGEGWDISMEEKGNSSIFQLHYNNLSAINLAVEKLNLGV